MKKLPNSFPKFALLAVTGAIPLVSQAASVAVDLTADIGSSSTSGFNGSVPAVLNDPFAYDVDNPTSVLPDQVYLNAAPGNAFHGISANPNIVLDLTGGTLTLGAGQSFFIDFYGRADCCLDRDDTFSVQFLSGGSGDGILGSVVTTLSTGISANAAPHHVRLTYSGAPFDSINVIGTSNNFTMMEVRAGLVPEPSTGLLALLGLSGFIRRRR